MNLYHYVYISQASWALDNAALHELLTSARSFNQDHHITGILLYSRETFMQLLEGSKAQIYALMEERIAQSRSHHSIYVVHEGEVAERSFKAWSMAFSNLDGVAADRLPSYSEFLEKGFCQELVTRELNTSHKLLLAFRESMRAQYD